MGAGSGVRWPAMLEMWMMDLGEGGGGGGGLVVEGEREEEERKWEMASWVVRIGCVRLMSRMA